jgi:hypothetical protein
LTADERLALILTKVGRAKKHIAELESEARSFLDSKPYVIGTKRNAETRNLVYYLVSVRGTPPTLAAVTGDVLQNLRSALDHLAYQLVLIGSGQPGPFFHVYFPIADSAAKYEAIKGGLVKGMRPEAVKAIDAVKPYPGGNDTVWRLHKLNNVDKHRLLITVGSAFRSMDIGGFMHRQLQRSLPADHPLRQSIADAKPLAAFFRGGDRMFPLKADDELFIDQPNAQVDEKLQFAFDLAFGEPQVVEGEPLLETLKQMADVVGELIAAFKPLLA